MFKKKIFLIQELYRIVLVAYLEPTNILTQLSFSYIFFSNIFQIYEHTFFYILIMILRY